MNNFLSGTLGPGFKKKEIVTNNFKDFVSFYNFWSIELLDPEPYDIPIDRQF